MREKSHKCSLQNCGESNRNMDFKPNQTDTLPILQLIREGHVQVYEQRFSSTYFVFSMEEHVVQSL